MQVGPSGLRQESGVALRKASAPSISVPNSLRAEFLSRIGKWAASAVPPLGALLGFRFASTCEAVGVPSSQFSCSKCETILEPGVNCSLVPNCKHKLYVCSYCGSRTPLIEKKKAAAAAAKPQAQQAASSSGRKKRRKWSGLKEISAAAMSVAHSSEKDVNTESIRQQLLDGGQKSRQVSEANFRLPALRKVLHMDRTSEYTKSKLVVTEVESTIVVAQCESGGSGIKHVSEGEADNVEKQETSAEVEMQDGSSSEVQDETAAGGAQERSLIAAENVLIHDAQRSENTNLLDEPKATMGTEAIQGNGHEKGIEKSMDEAETKLLDEPKATMETEAIQGNGHEKAIEKSAKFPNNDELPSNDNVEKRSDKDDQFSNKVDAEGLPQYKAENEAELPQYESENEAELTKNEVELPMKDEAEKLPNNEAEKFPISDDDKQADDMTMEEAEAGRTSEEADRTVDVMTEETDTGKMAETADVADTEKTAEDVEKGNSDAVMTDTGKAEGTEATEVDKVMTAEEVLAAFPGGRILGDYIVDDGTDPVNRDHRQEAGTSTERRVPEESTSGDKAVPKPTKLQGVVRSFLHAKKLQSARHGVYLGAVKRQFKRIGKRIRSEEKSRSEELSVKLRNSTQNFLRSKKVAMASSQVQIASLRRQVAFLPALKRRITTLSSEMGQISRELRKVVHALDVARSTFAKQLAPRPTPQVAHGGASTSRAAVETNKSVGMGNSNVGMMNSNVAAEPTETVEPARAPPKAEETRTRTEAALRVSGASRGIQKRRWASPFKTSMLTKVGRRWKMNSSF